MTPISRPAVFAGLPHRALARRERDAVHGARGRHAERHVADAAEVLQRIEQARPDDLQRGAHERTSFAQSKVPASTSRAMRS